jgi:hypothetical protein
MSGVLDRMLLRPRQALSSVEPLVAPRYAPASLVSLYSEPAAITEKQRNQSSDSQANIFSERTTAPTQHTAKPASVIPEYSKPNRGLSNVTRDDDYTAPSSVPVHSVEHSLPQEVVTQRTGTAPVMYPVMERLRSAAQPALSKAADRKDREIEQQVSSTEVNITIGHIEVRAVPHPQPVRKSSAIPHVKLDDYLHRRNEGAR